jgi:hypothetical protein
MRPGPESGECRSLRNGSNRRSPHRGAEASPPLCCPCERAREEIPPARPRGSGVPVLHTTRAELGSRFPGMSGDGARSEHFSRSQITIMRTRFAVRVWTPRHLIACGLMGEPVPPVITSGGPQKKNS